MLDKNSIKNFMKRSNSKNKLSSLGSKKNLIHFNDNNDIKESLNNNDLEINVIDDLSNELCNSLTDFVEDKQKGIHFEIHELNMNNDDYIFRNTMLILISGLMHKIKRMKDIDISKNKILLESNDLRNDNDNVIVNVFFKWIIPFLIQTLIRDFVSLTFHSFLTKIHEFHTLELPIN